VRLAIPGPQAAIAKNIDMIPSTFSSAISDGGDRGFNEAQFAALKSLLEQRRGDWEDQVDDIEKEGVDILFQAVFGSSGTSAFDCAPGQEVAIGAMCYVDRYADLRRRFIARPKPYWIIAGGPMTGKSAEMLRLNSDAARAGIRTVFCDFGADVRRLSGRSDDDVIYTVFETVFAAITSDYHDIAWKKVPVNYLPRDFTNRLQEKAIQLWGGEPTFLLIDNLNKITRSPAAYDAFRSVILGCSSLKVPGLSVIMADDGSAVDSFFMSSVYSRCDPLAIGDTSVSSIVELSEKLLGSNAKLNDETASQGRDKLSGCLYLHHLALERSRQSMSKLSERQSNSSMASRTYLDNCDKIISQLLSWSDEEFVTSGDPSDYSLSGIRHRILELLLAPRQSEQLAENIVLEKIRSISEDRSSLSEAHLPLSYRLPLQWSGLASNLLPASMLLGAIARWCLKNLEKNTLEKAVI
jgi:hypothetical protein